MHLALAIPLGISGLYIAILAILGVMSFLSVPRASFLYRMMAAFGSLIACAIYGSVASLILRLVGQHRISQWATARAYKWTMALSTGVRFNVISGAEYLETRPNVFVSNHQTALDVLMLGSIFPPYCSVTAKKQLAMMPFLGWFMALSGTVFIDRAHKEVALKAFEGAAKEMREHRQSVWIFPEGTRSNTNQPTMLGFKKGAFHLAVQAQVPIVPVVSACYWGVMSLKEHRFRAGEVPVIVLAPIPTANLTAADVDQLTQYTRNLMLDALVKLTESPQGQQAFRARPPPLALPGSTASVPNGEKSPVGAQLDAAQVAFRKKIGVA